MSVQRISTSLLAGVAFADGEYRAVVISSGKAAKQSVKNAPSLGINQNTGAIDTALEICMGGRCKMQFGAVVAEGAELTSDAIGRGITAGAGEYVCALAMAAGVAGGIYDVVAVTPYQKN